MPGLGTPALILQLAERGDDDRWASLLCPELGRIQALARHARGSKRRFGGALQPFILVNAALRSRSGGLFFLEDLHALEHPLGAEPSLEELAAGWFFLELAQQLCPQGQPQPAFFELLLGGLRRVGKRVEPLAAVRLSVLWGALDLEGWAPSLDHCQRCGSQPPWDRFSLDPAAGACLCGACSGALQGEALPGAVWDQWRAAAEGRPMPGTLPQAESALLRWVEHQIGRPLQAARFNFSPIGD